MKLALADKPPVPFKVPAGIKLIRVDAKSGMRAGPGDGGRTILEAFKPGTAPPDNYICHRRGRCRGARAAAMPRMPAAFRAGRVLGYILRPELNEDYSLAHCALLLTPLHPRSTSTMRSAAADRDRPCALKSKAS